MPKSLIIFMAFLLIGCEKSQHEDAAGDSYGPNAQGPDLHPDPQIIIRESGSIYEEIIKLVSDKWNGTQWVDNTFECTSASLDRVLEFLYMKEGGDTPKVYGLNILPKHRYMIDFGDRTWNSKEDARSDILDAIKTTFGITLDYSHEEHSLRITPISTSDSKKAERGGMTSLCSASTLKRW